MNPRSLETRELLAREGLAPRKHLGQHFLVDSAVVDRMVRLADVQPTEAVLEIGPGTGALTAVLAQRAARLYVIEYDRGLCDLLRRRYAEGAGVRVIEGDALRVDLRAEIPEQRAKVVASLPYNVSVPILFRLLEERHIFSDVTVMLQREVAQRLVAAPGTSAYGAPSLLFQLYGEVHGRFGVSPGAFYPRPQVASEVLRLRFAVAPRVRVDDPRLFGLLVRAAFNHRRKMLRNALQGVRGCEMFSPAVWEALLTAAGIDARARGETLDMAAFAALADEVGRAMTDASRAR